MKKFGNDVRRFTMHAALVGLALLAGCGDGAAPAPAGSAGAPQDSGMHDPDDAHVTAQEVERPKDFAAAVARIEQYRDRIRDEIAAGRPAKVHRPLDEAVFVLRWLPEIARDSGIARSHWEEVNTLAQEIEAALDRVHARIDAQQDPDFASVAAEVQRAIDRLKAIAAQHTPGAQP